MMARFRVRRKKMQKRPRGGGHRQDARRGMPQDAAQEPFDALTQPNIRLATFCCSSAYDLPSLAAALQSRFADINLIGCTTAGENTPMGYLDGSLTGFSLASGDLEVVTHRIELDPFDHAESAGAVSAMRQKLDERDGVSPNPQNTFAFLLIDGLSIQGEMVVTKADTARRIVYAINGRPAAHEFARLVGVSITERTTLVFVAYPVVVRIGGETFVRSIGKVNDDERLQFSCAIDEGIVLTITRGVDLVQHLRESFDKVRAEIGLPQSVLGCDCVLRRLECDRPSSRWSEPTRSGPSLTRRRGRPGV